MQVKMNNNFFSYQLGALHKIKKTFRNNINIRNNIFYNQTWSISIGLIYLLKKYFNLSKVKYYINVVKQFYLYEKSEFYLQGLNQKNYKTIFLTWYNKKNHNKTRYHDNYLNILNNDDHILFILLSEKKIKNLPNNSVCLVTNHQNCKLYIFDYLKIIIDLSKIILLDKFIFKYSSKRDNFFIKSILLLVKKSKIRTFLLPYEAQQWQDLIIEELFKNNIKTIGYLHSSIPAFPAEFIYKHTNIHKLVVHGFGHKNILLQLGWPQKKLRIKRSFRYTKKRKKHLREKIFLPHTFLESPKNQIKFFQNSLKYLPQLNIKIKKLSIKNHPLMSKSQLHKELKNEINKIIKKNINFNNNFNKNNLISFDTQNKYCSIFFGTTASIIEALENNINVLHICSIDFIEAYNPNIWEYINIIRLEKNIFYYSLKRNKAYIDFGTNKINKINTIINA